MQSIARNLHQLDYHSQILYEKPTTTLPQQENNELCNYLYINYISVAKVYK